MIGDKGMLLTPYNEDWRIKKSILRQFLNPRSVSQLYITCNVSCDSILTRAIYITCNVSCDSILARAIKELRNLNILVMS